MIPYLTISILDAILNDLDYEKYLRKYTKEYLNYHLDFNLYFKTSFSPQFIKWYEVLIEGKSLGNGAIMRISPVGYLFDSENEVKKQAQLAILPSHNSIEALEASQIVVLIIYYGRIELSKRKS